MIDVSIVIPMHNEAGNVEPLVTEVLDACVGLGGFEVIVVDDASSDDTFARAVKLASTHPNVRVLRHESNAGQSAAVHSGVLAAKGGVVCTMDGDGQNPASELEKLFKPLLASSSDRIGLVAGQRVARQDTMSKKLASRIANGIRGWMLQDGTRDTGCGLKGFRRDAFLTLPYFDHMHRYLPALFKRDGWEIVLVDVTHRERQAGKSKYNNFQRALVGIYDLIGVAWLIRRRKKSRTIAAEDMR